MLVSSHCYLPDGQKHRWTDAFPASRWSRWARRELIRQPAHGALAADDSWEYKKVPSLRYRPMAQGLHSASRFGSGHRVNNRIPLPVTSDSSRLIRY